MNRHGITAEGIIVAAPTGGISHIGYTNFPRELFYLAFLSRLFYRRDQPQLGVVLQSVVVGGEAMALMPAVVLGEHAPVEIRENLLVRAINAKDAAFFPKLH